MMDYEEVKKRLERILKESGVAKIFNIYLDIRTISKDRRLLKMLEDKNLFKSLTTFIRMILEIEKVVPEKDTAEYPPEIRKMIYDMAMLKQSKGTIPTVDQIATGIFIQRVYGSHKQINKRKSRMIGNDQIKEIKRKIETMAKEAGFGVNVVPIDLRSNKKSIDTSLDTLIDTLGDMVDKEKKEHPEAKLLKCLPCVEEMFETISKKRGGDLLADSGRLSIKILFACLGVDIENHNTDMSERFISTLIMFSKLTGLLEGKGELAEVVSEIEKTMEKG